MTSAIAGLVTTERRIILPFCHHMIVKTTKVMLAWVIPCTVAVMITVV
jgi:hypothetical protein